MGNIVLLDDLTINKIAAGEVIERPANVVKELVENSIDAGATKIIIEIKNGGKTFIKITDNGVGMDREDAVLAFSRHATSKLKNEDDENLISTKYLVTDNVIKRVKEKIKKEQLDIQISRSFFIFNCFINKSCNSTHNNYLISN
mgnify:CR=1 FL=1